MGHACARPGEARRGAGRYVVDGWRLDAGAFVRTVAQVVVVVVVVVVVSDAQGPPSACCTAALTDCTITLLHLG